MLDVKRNNLDRSLSPYLIQHVSNPVWWQEWSTEIINEAVRENKPLFVSVGYATCHWCHVMAAGAFSDKETADYLNKHFICIKVDREQRPDIDKLLMNFLTVQSGSGGWPLNVFLTPEVHPIFALTFAPASSSGSMKSFLTIAGKVYEYYQNNVDKIQQFEENEEQPGVVAEESIVKKISAYFDHDNGGFGNRQKFPPHSTLLYLLYFICVDNNADAVTICVKTLDAMRLRGLNDHLQGGIFRYCVGPEWSIPHFEKMLYDQAMALWCYSLAYKVIKKKEYMLMADNIIRCLEECFEQNGLFISAHDADTGHVEGAAYTWSYDELKKVLSPGEFKKFSDSYQIERSGNFEGKIHLIRKNDNDLSEIENKLLRIRKLRAQPESDNKILCGLNALTAIAMIQAGRYLEKPLYEEKASKITHSLMDLFWDGKTLGHSFYNGATQKQSFLFDAAAMLTLISMLYENDGFWGAMMDTMIACVLSFKDSGKWIESRAEDFQTVYASWSDNPIPSSIGLAEMGLTRAAMLTGKPAGSKQYRQPLQCDFFNITEMINNGLFHIITAENIIPWSKLQPNTLQKRGKTETDCYKGTCKMFG
ncbi:MAG: DUF255 domain-containing protein [bacterium]|nr:DUF255 domain-containing protein [bacterium]